MKYLIRLITTGASLAVLGSCTSGLPFHSTTVPLRQTIHFAGTTVSPQILDSANDDVETSITLPSLENDASLRECLVYASLMSPELKVAFHNWKASLSRIPQVTALADPKVSLGYFIEEIQTRTGPMEQQLSLSQSFPWWGLLEAKGDVAKSVANSKWHEYESVRLNIFQKVVKRWTAVVDLENEISVITDSFELLAQAERIARRSYEVNGTSHSRLVQLQVELGKLEDKLSNLNNLRGPRIAALNATLARNGKDAFNLPSSIHLNVASITLEDAIQLVAKNPAINAHNATIEQHQLAIKVAELDAKPKWTVGLTYTNLGDPLDPSTPDAGNDPIMGMIGFSIPLNQTKTDAAKSEAMSKKLAAIAAKEALLHELNAAIAEAIYQRDDSMRSITFYETALIPRAEDALGAVLVAFSTGTTSAIELLDSQRTLLELQRNLQRSYVAALNADATISKLVGGAVKTELSQ
ncbi:MAG TPA: TolC family protein [Phycisphaerales bacterium]|nr:TolC family protein [Phycisphaerales bacterium]